MHLFLYTFETRASSISKKRHKNLWQINGSNYFDTTNSSDAVTVKLLIDTTE